MDDRTTLLGVNWFGLVTGILMLILAIFAIPWWGINAGGGALTTAVSPFYMDFSLLGTSSIIPLVWFVCLGQRIFIIIWGALLVTGSIFPTRWWGRTLVKSSAFKLLWMIVGLLIIGILASVIASAAMPSIVPGMQASLPVLSGSSTIVVPMQAVTMTIPITMGLGLGFPLAIIGAALGVTSRFYQKKLENSGKLKVRPAGETVMVHPAEKKKVINVRPT